MVKIRLKLRTEKTYEAESCGTNILLGTQEIEMSVLPILSIIWCFNYV